MTLKLDTIAKLSENSVSLVLNRALTGASATLVTLTEHQGGR
jgi:hypothetical protein